MANKNASRKSAPSVTVIDHQAKLVQARVSEQAKSIISALANQRGLSEAALLREMIYKGLGLNQSKETP